MSANTFIEAGPGRNDLPTAPDFNWASLIDPPSDFDSLVIKPIYELADQLKVSLGAFVVIAGGADALIGLAHPLGDIDMVAEKKVCELLINTPGWNKQAHPNGELRLVDDERFFDISTSWTFATGEQQPHGLLALTAIKYKGVLFSSPSVGLAWRAAEKRAKDQSILSQLERLLNVCRNQHTAGCFIERELAYT